MTDVWSSFSAEPETAAPPTPKPATAHSDVWGSFSSEQPTQAAEQKPFGLADTWPARLAKQAWGAFTLPGDVYAGKVDPLSDEAIGRSADIAMLANPTPAAMRGGEGILGAATGFEAAPGRATLSGPRGLVPSELPAAPAGVRAGQTATEIGAPLPVGMASDNPVVQATTQAARQLPLVGPKITEKVGKTVGAAGEKVGDVASELGGGVTDRATAGANIRPALENVVEANNATIDQHYAGLRGMIDADRAVPLPNTSKVLDKIISERRAQGQVKPEVGLENYINLGTMPGGTSFNGLQRARSALSHEIDFGKANPGYDVGDLKRLRGAITQDMEHVASQTTNPGVSGADAVAAWKAADKAAGPLFEYNKVLKQLTNNQRDEGIIGSLVGAANAKTGNVQLLAKLRSSMPAEDFEQISAVALHELGYKPATDSFSLSQFTRNWNNLAPQAKSVLFSPKHQKFLDDIANLGAHLKDADKFLNTSNTGGAVNLSTGLVGAAGAVGTAVMTGSFWPVAAAASAGVGGYVLAAALAKESSAAAVAAWARAVRGVAAAPTPARQAALRIAERNVLNNIPELRDMSARMQPPQAKDQTSLTPATTRQP